MANEIFISELSTWVPTDVDDYVTYRTIEDWLLEKHPRVWDTKNERWIQEWKIEVIDLLGVPVNAPNKLTEEDK